jgi:hypothetical protein
MGGGKISSNLGSAYLDWVLSIHEQSHGNGDLVAHFFRRAFGLIRQGGTFGMIATNTIGQGDTRSTGLRWICTHGGTIYEATRRLKWPGLAAVVVSVVHVGRSDHQPRMCSNRSVGLTTCNTSFDAPYVLDDRPAAIITAYLFHAGGHDDPEKLVVNSGKIFKGTFVCGMGFTFDDSDTKGVASPIAEMHRLIAKDPRNAERIFPYIGGEEINESPMHAHHRYVINFGEMSEEEARRWPDLMRILKEKVEGTRAAHSTAEWWHFERLRAELYEAIRSQERVLVMARHQPHWTLAFMPTDIVFSDAVNVIATSHDSSFATLQSRAHETWARFFGSSLEDRLRYTPSDCFETFPFPLNFDIDPALQSTGKAYYEFRAYLMIRNNEGLTKTYNRFHDPDERSPDIFRLRELHSAMDRAVLDAYGWTDLKPTCEFLLDYEEDEDDDDAPSKGRGRKKPWRYRWPDDFRDEVLARLLELNRQRAEEERLSGAAAEAGNGKAGKKSSRGAKAGKKKADQPELFES